MLLENSNNLKMNVKFSIEKVFEGIGVVTDPFRNSLLRKKKFMMTILNGRITYFNVSLQIDIRR